MPSLDNLPGDQRAVLEMVLKRGRSYDDIARLLSLDRAAVRERAQIALDTIGPHAEVAPEQQHRIADYLLGQLSDADAAAVRDLLADSPSDRAWARVVSSELAPLTGGTPLPEIPVERAAPREPAAPPAAASEPPTIAPPLVAPAAEPSAPEPVAAPSAEAPVSGLGPAQPEGEPKRRRGRRRGQGRDDGVAGGAGTGTSARRSSRLGGALVILVGLVAVGAVLFFVLRGGHAKKPAVSTTSVPAASVTSTATASTPTTTTTGTSASVVAQINLTPPASDKKSKAAGIAEVLNEGSTDGVAIVAQNVPANATKPPNAYAVWLYNSQTDAKILGFVTPSVGKTGRLQTAGRLPSNASHYKQLVVTVETTAKPKTPGSIILQGALSKL